VICVKFTQTFFLAYTIYAQLFLISIFSYTRKR